MPSPLVAIVAALHVRLARCHVRTAQAEADARIDPLTGALNRRGWEDALRREQARLGRRRGRAAVVVLDLTGLKARNESEGHAAGDRLLAEAARQLTRAARADDYVARLGGDEFALLALDARSVRLLRSRVRRALARAGIDAAYGFAAAIRRRGLHEALAAADRMLVEQKRSRRATR
jgi:diguanylate cyclase (GGDEF)-like protein